MKQKPMAAPKVCRVCLVSDRTMYRVANTELEETYEQVSREKWRQIGRPVTLCSICVSQLRGCRRFARAAQDSNKALDNWYKNRTDKLNLTVKPLLSLITTSPEVLDFISNGIQDVEVKQEITTDVTKEINTSGNESATQTEERSTLIRDYDYENDNTCVSDEGNNNTLSNVFGDLGETLIDVSDIKQPMSDDENDYTQLSESIDIKYEVIQLEDFAPSTSDIGYDETNCGSDDEYVPKPRTRTKANSGKATKVKRALTGAERVRRYREKLKQNREKFEEVRRKNLSRMKIYRKKIHELTEEEKHIKRKHWREAKEQQRIKKKGNERKVKNRHTAAEKAKRYREKLKQNPEKFEEMRIKNLMRIKNSRKKINDLTEEEKEIRRHKWREEKRSNRKKTKS